MLKRDESTTETSCWNKARADERVFVLLARDDAAPETIRFWVARRVELGKNQRGDPQVLAALDDAARMEDEGSRINYRPHGGGMSGHDRELNAQPINTANIVPVPLRYDCNSCGPYAPTDATNIVPVLLRYAAYLQGQDAAFRTEVAISLNRHLDELLNSDAFGTEGQCDPRGDHRE